MNGRFGATIGFHPRASVVKLPSLTVALLTLLLRPLQLSLPGINCPELDRARALRAPARRCGGESAWRRVLSGSGSVPVWDNPCEWQSYSQDELNQTPS